MKAAGRCLLVFGLLWVAGCAQEPRWRYSGELHARPVGPIEAITISMNMGKFGSSLYEPQFEGLLTQSISDRFGQYSIDVAGDAGEGSANILYIKSKGGTRLSRTDRRLVEATFLVRLLSADKSPLYSMRILIKPNSPGIDWVWDEVTAEAMTDAIFKGLIGAGYLEAATTETPRT